MPLKKTVCVSLWKKSRWS